MTTLVRRIVAEGLGTALLLAAVVGSGIMGERLAAGNLAVTLLANSIATGGVLMALIMTFGSISGANFNPAVTLADAVAGSTSWRDVPAYVISQLVGAFVGVAAAHAMFGEPLFAASLHERSGAAQAFSEFVATFGLMSVIRGSARSGFSFTPFAVAGYIVGAYWFTASTSFANPAVTLARSMTSTFAGIRLIDAPLFVLMQFVGALAAAVLFRWLTPVLPAVASVVPAHSETEPETA
jgi:glycerol uptake facilitator-like aquaporin